MDDHLLPGGTRLWVPPGFTPEHDGTTVLTWHLHGAHATVQQAFQRARCPGVLLTLTLPGLSGVYTKHFAADPTGVFGQTLASAQKALGLRGWSRVWVSSFSAGFGGVRELLKAPAVVAQLDALILADTLYAGYAHPPSASIPRPKPNPSDLAGFVAFAKAAAEHRDRSLLVTYCDLLPPDYSATRETAHALREAVGVENAPRNDAWPDDLLLTSHCRQGRFATYGFAGDDGPAHLRHLRGLAYFYRLVPRV